jgi:A/G-specific adenine glycosylase
LFAHDAPAAATQRWAWEVARELVPRHGAGDWNQALMELGATVCTARDPSCSACPVATACRALATNGVPDLPRVRPQPRAIDVELVAFVVERGERLLVERRPAGGRMAGLWQLPTVQTAGDAHLFPAELSLTITAEPRGALATIRHAITHHRIRLEARLARCDAAEVAPPFRWATPREAAALPITGMTRKLLAALAPDRARSGRRMPE